MKIRQILLCSAFTPMFLQAQVITLPSKTINCGQVQYKHPVKAEFKMQNTGKQPLLIKNIRTSCGCTTVTYPTDAIAPGDSFTVSAVYDAKQMGHFQKEIGIYSNADTQPLMLTIKGVVVEEVSNFEGEFPYSIGDVLADKADLFFDNVNRGEQPIEKIHILNNGNVAITPQLMHLPPYLKGEVKPTRVAPGRSATIMLQVDSHKLNDLGLTHTSIYLGSFQGDKVSTDKEIDVNIVLLPNFEKLTETQIANAPKLQLSKGSLNFSKNSQKSKEKDEIVITNIGKSKLSIRSLQIIGSGLDISLNKQNIAPGETAKLKVSAIKSMIEKARTAPKVLMITNDPSQPKVIVNTAFE